MSSLPPASKVRRRKLSSIGLATKDDLHGSAAVDGSAGDAGISHNEAIRSLLDTTLVGISRENETSVEHQRRTEYAAFSQSQLKSTIVSSGNTPNCSQSEVR